MICKGGILFIVRLFQSQTYINMRRLQLETGCCVGKCMYFPCSSVGVQPKTAAPSERLLQDITLQCDVFLGSHISVNFLTLMNS